MSQERYVEKKERRQASCLGEQVACVVPPEKGRVGLWFELDLDWPPQPLHSCAPDTDTYVKGPISKISNESKLRMNKKA